MRIIKLFYEQKHSYSINIRMSNSTKDLTITVQTLIVDDQLDREPVGSRLSIYTSPRGKKKTRKITPNNQKYRSSATGNNICSLRRTVTFSIRILNASSIPVENDFNKSSYISRDVLPAYTRT